MMVISHYVIEVISPIPELKTQIYNFKEIYCKTAANAPAMT
jgi:hypothetical protein